LVFVSADAARVVAAPKYDINTLAGKITSLRELQILQIRFSAFIEEEAENRRRSIADTITPVHVLSSPRWHHRRPECPRQSDTAGAPKTKRRSRLIRIIEPDRWRSERLRHANMVVFCQWDTV
jgi:hypothetical protein